MKCKHIVFLIVLLLDILDFICDWLFCADIFILEKGLVYGPVSPGVKWSLLAFAIIGTLTFIMELLNLKQEAVDSDVLSAVVIWIEDVPQIIISYCIATCREEPISIFQLFKASVVLFGIVVRFAIALHKYCCSNEEKSRHHLKYKVVLILGMLLEAGFAIAIFYYTNTEPDRQGQPSFKVPTTTIEERFNDQRYFANVSIFLHHAELFDAPNLDPDKADETFNWMRLISINKLRESSPNKEALFSFDWEPRSADVTKFAVSEYDSKTSQWALTECYDIDRSTAVITELTNATFFTNPQKMYIKFQYDPPGSIFKKKVFGDIYMNMRQQTGGGTCQEFRDYTDSISAGVGGKFPITLQYFRTAGNNEPQGTKHLLHSNGVSPRFFRNDDVDLEEILSVWKTGWNNCESTGSVAPNWDDDLLVECNRP